MIIVDTGVWLALANRKDRYHEVAVQTLAGLHEPLVTTWPVVTESCHLLAVNLGPTALERFLSSVAQGAVQVFDLGDRHLPRIIELMRKFADLPMDLADASLVVLAEELGTGRILSTDQREFRTNRWKQKRPFRNLLDLG